MSAYCEHCPMRGACHVCGSDNARSFADEAQEASDRAALLNLRAGLSSQQPTGPHWIPSHQVGKIQRAMFESRVLMALPWWVEPVLRVRQFVARLGLGLPA